MWRPLAAMVVVVAALALASSAQLQCGDPPLGYLYPASSAECPAFRTCGSDMCACAGSAGTNATTCLRTASVGCPIVEGCVAAYHECLGGIAQLTGNASAPCFTLASSVHFARLAAAMGYAGSRLEASCRHHSCVVVANTSCDVNTASVCIAPATTVTTTAMLPTTTTATTATTTEAASATTTTSAAATTLAPSTVPATTATTAAPVGTIPFTPAVTATLRIEGSAFEALLLPWNRAALEAAVRGDLARVLSVADAYVFIQRLALGSLAVDFAVSADAGVPPADLAGRLMAVTHGNAWLAATQGVYSAVSDERLVVGTAPVLTSSAAPGAVTGPPTPTPTFPLALIGSPAAAYPSALAQSVASLLLLLAAATDLLVL